MKGYKQARKLYKSRKEYTMKKINGKEIMNIAIGLTIPMITFNICATLIRSIYAGIVTKDSFLIALPIVLVVLWKVIAYWIRKKFKKPAEIMKKNKKSILFTFIGILWFIFLFYLDFFYKRPSVENINEMQENIEILFSQDNMTNLKNLHMAGSASLQILMQVNDVIEQTLECAEEIELYKEKELTEEEKLELVNFVNQKKEEMNRQQENINLLKQNVIILAIIKDILLLIGATFVYEGKRKVA